MKNFDGQWYPVKSWIFSLFGLLGKLLFGNMGIGIRESGLVLKGIGKPKEIPWEQIQDVRQGGTSLMGAGAVPALLGALAIKGPLLVTRKDKAGSWTVPVHQTGDPQAIIKAIAEHMGLEDETA